MSSVTACFRRGTGSSSYYAKTRKVNERHTDGERRNKLPFAGDTVICVENLKDSTKNPTGTNKELQSKVQDTRLIRESQSPFCTPAASKRDLKLKGRYHL